MRSLALFLLLCRSAYAADPLLVAQIVVCESSSRPNVCGDDGVSCGIAQFKRETFFSFAKKSGLKHPNYMDMTQQVFLLDWALNHGLGWNWTCYKIVTDKRALPSS